VILLLVLVSVGLVVVSPWVLRALGGADLDWTRLSDIGQTYGAVSAVIAAVALLGVVASLVIQRKEAKAARVNAQREHHVELMRMAMDDPVYMNVFGPYLTESFERERQLTYVNLLIAQWYTEYDIGEPSGDHSLRAAAVDVFKSPPGRRYWEMAGPYWRDNYRGRRARRFQRILDDAYREALNEPAVRPPVPASPIPTVVEEARRQPNRWLVAAGLVTVVVGLTAVYRALRRR
jgi:hypothetical protein